MPMCLYGVHMLFFNSLNLAITSTGSVLPVACLSNISHLDIQLEMGSVRRYDIVSFNVVSGWREWMNHILSFWSLESHEYVPGLFVAYGRFASCAIIL